MPPASLIITGDDFGSNHEVNEAVEVWHRAGLLTQASLMVHGPFVGEAVRIAQRNPELCVGLHLTLCAGNRVGATGLTDAEGNFEPRPGRAGWRFFWNRSLEPLLQTEIAEQIARFTATGLPAVYWDGHTHLHLHPVIRRLTMPLAAEAGFRAVRVVQTRGCGVLGWIFNRLSAAAKPSLDMAGIRFTDRLLGFAGTGRMDEKGFVRCLNQTQAGQMTELYFHPGVDGKKVDFQVLREDLDRKNLQLTHWRDACG